MKRWSWWMGGVLALVAVAMCREPPVEEPPAQPNVLVIVWDTVRADRLGPWGYAPETTPWLDRFVEESHVYAQARSPGIWTLPSHASMFTGLAPSTTGADERWLWLDGRHLTLAEHLKAQGYQTAAFTANALLSQDTNLLQGFDLAVHSWSPKLAPLAKARTERKILPGDRSHELVPGYEEPEHGARNAEWARAMYKEAGPLLVEGVLRFVDQRADEDPPWFVFLNLMEAHTPRIPSLESRKALMDEATFRTGLETDQSHINLHFYNFGKTSFTEEELAAISAVYDASIRDLDRMTEDLMTGLTERGLLDDTVVVLTSDHGENLGDHHLFNHRFALWDSLIHVPLVVRYPSKVEPGRTTTPVSTGDLFASLVGLAGLEHPEGLEPHTWFDDDGATVVSEMALPLRREVRTVQRVYPDVVIEPWMRSGRALVEGEDKWIRWDQGSTERYHIGHDPQEFGEASGAEPGGDERLDAALSGWVAEQAPYDPALRGPEDDPKVVRASQEELRAQLEALGYLQEEE
jgi:arylsulfatase A-like enzyme